MCNTCLTKNRTKIVASNPLKADPTRTTQLRLRFEQLLRGKFAKLKQEIFKLIVEDDAFGIKRKTPVIKNMYIVDGASGSRDNSPTLAEKLTFGNSWGDLLTTNQPGRWQFQTTSKQVESFENWIQNQIDEGILDGKTGKTKSEGYWRAFSDDGYRRGAGRAFNDVRKPALSTGRGVSDFFDGTRDEFLRQSFGRPVAVDKLKLLAGRVFTDLQGITTAMSTQLSRQLVDGLSRGAGPATIAAEMLSADGPLQQIGARRATLLARTEIIRAHAEGQLDAFENLGVTEIGVMAEWLTAGDDRVCPLCEALEGSIMTVKEARGLIPRHAQCVIGDSRVIADDVLSVMKTHYTGEIIELVTSKGRRLSVTANHILLTKYGFLPARFAYNGLKVMTSPAIDSDSAVTPDDYSGKSCIADIFTSFAKNSLMVSESMPLSPEDLHGDGQSCNSEVNVIRPNSELWDKGWTECLTSHVQEEFPAFQFFNTKLGLNASSSLTQFLEATARTFDSSMGSHRELLALLLGRLLHSHVHGLASVSNRNPTVFKSFANRSTTTLKSLRKSLNAHPLFKQLEDLNYRELEEILLGFTSFVLPNLQIDSSFFESLANTVIANPQTLSQSSSSFSSFISFDQIVSVNVSHVSNLPVYDVQTASTVYRVNGVVSSNCRCSFIPANVGESTKKQVRGQKNVQQAIDDSIRAEIPKGRIIKGGARRFQNPVTGEGAFTFQTKRTLAQQKTRSRWLGADRTILKRRPKAVVKPLRKPSVVKPKPTVKPKIPRGETLVPWNQGNQLSKIGFEPPILFRGTAGESLSAFGGPESTNLIFLSTDEAFATRYASQFENGKVHRLFVRANNPIDISQGRGFEIWKRYTKEMDIPSFGAVKTKEGLAVSWTQETPFRKWLEKNGIDFDAIYFAENDGSRSLAVRSLTQMKATKDFVPSSLKPFTHPVITPKPPKVKPKPLAKPPATKTVSQAKLDGALEEIALTEEEALGVLRTGRTHEFWADVQLLDDVEPGALGTLKGKLKPKPIPKQEDVASFSAKVKRLKPGTERTIPPTNLLGEPGFDRLIVGTETQLKGVDFTQRIVVFDAEATTTGQGAFKKSIAKLKKQGLPIRMDNVQTERFRKGLERLGFKRSGDSMVWIPRK